MSAKPDTLRSPLDFSKRRFSMSSGEKQLFEVSKSSRVKAIVEDISDANDSITLYFVQIEGREGEDRYVSGELDESTTDYSLLDDGLETFVGDNYPWDLAERELAPDGILIEANQALTASVIIDRP